MAEIFPERAHRVTVFGFDAEHRRHLGRRQQLFVLRCGIHRDLAPSPPRRCLASLGFRQRSYHLPGLSEMCAPRHDRPRSSQLTTHRGPSRAPRRVPACASPWGDDGQHAEPEVEHVLHLVVGDVAGPLDLGEDPRLLPAPRVDDRVAVGRAAPARGCRGCPPPVTCANACTVDVSPRASRIAGA